MNTFINFIHYRNILKSCCVFSYLFDVFFDRNKRPLCVIFRRCGTLKNSGMHQNASRRSRDPTRAKFLVYFSQISRAMICACAESLRARAEPVPLLFKYLNFKVLIFSFFLCMIYFGDKNKESEESFDIFMISIV